MNKVTIPYLDKAAIAEIVYAMENQDVDFVVNKKTWQTCPSESLGEFFGEFNEDDFLEPPKWTSADGYQLMCSYTLKCGNPKTKRALENELNSKQRGVFRRFRSVLDQDPDSLQQWYEFKDRKLVAHVRAWLSDLAKSNPELFMTSDSSSVESEDEPAGALLADFDIAPCEDAMSCKDICALVDATIVGMNRRLFDCLDHKKAFAVYKASELCGTIIYIVEKEEASILFYHVQEQYRGMGLFTLMLDALNRKLEREGVKKVSVLCDSKSSFIRMKLHDLDVATKTEMELFSYNISKWNETIPSVETAYVL